MHTDAVNQEDSILNKYLAKSIEVLFECLINPYLKVNS